ncbi:tudor domain-containing protein 15 [Pithys albifrons albifrons]|uniref:tudor domain-containing protein 15 n=1 Tax=Pithys albifrons albifrons TaxID=3385563 RepID=UPI003A5CED77
MIESLTPLPDRVDMKLKITHVECHPECLFIMFHAQHSAGCEPDYCILQNEIQRVLKVKANVSIGGSCLVEDTEGEWHRGRVLGKRENICEAYLIDTGCVMVVEETHLAAACDELFQLPPKVVLGVFASVLPLGEKWGPNAINYFSSLVGLQITGHVKAVIPHQLFILEVPKIIADVLELQLGRFIDGDSFCLIVETLRALPEGRVCRRMPQLLKQNFSVKELLTLNNSEKPTDFWHVIDELFPCLPVGNKENVKITGAISPNKFYCQIQKWQKELEDLTGAMHLYYEALTGENTASCDSLGLLCAAKRQSGQWHRGVIKQLLSGHVEVWFMDFGITEAVPPSSVHKLGAEFMTLPMISFPCALSCFGKQDETVIKVQLRKLMQALIEQTSVCVTLDLYNNIEHLYYITLQKQDLGSNAKHPENLNEAAASCGSLLGTKITSIAENCKRCPKRYNLLKNYTVNKDRKTSLPEQDSSFSSHCKREEMQINYFYEAFVVHIVNPSDFWIQPCRYKNAFQALMKNIACVYSHCGADEMVLKEPEPGVLCCARYSKDGCFYRAVVTKVLCVNITVKFLDFGNTDTVPCHDVKTLLPAFSDLPALAMCCSLACTFPTDGVWVKKETDFFKSIVLNRKLLLYVIGKENNKYIVNVHCNGLHQGNVAMYMIQAGYAEYWEKPPGSVLKSARKRQNWNYINCKKSKINAVSTSKSKVPGNGDILQKKKSSVSPMPIKSVLPSCFGEGTVSKMHKSVCEGKLFYKEFLFKPGDVFEVVCSCFFSPSDFSCQLQSKLPELNNLMGRIQARYKDHTNPYKSGQVACIVKYPKDGKWYRATVVQQVSKNEVDVVFIDYGYRERVLLKDLQAVLPDFLTLESQAFRCGLKNVSLQTDSLSWSEEVHRQFEDFISSSGEPLTCIIYAVVLVSPNCLCNVVDLRTPRISAEEFLRECGLTQSECGELRNLASLGSLYSFCYSSFDIKIGSEEEVYITHINSPSKFYCQLNRNTETVEALMKRVGEISKMSNNVRYDTSRTRLFIARYFEDGLFYRALAFPVESTSYLYAKYVDFGNKSMVERDQLIPIPDSATDLLFTPMQAIKCYLSDLRGENIPASITKWFEERFLGKLLKAVILSRESDGKIVVELYDGKLKVSQKLKEKISEELSQKSCMLQFTSNEEVRCHMEDEKEINKVSVKNPEIPTLKTEVKCQVYDEFYQTDTGENCGDEGQTACSTPKLCSGSLKHQTSQDSREPGFRDTSAAVLQNRDLLIGKPASHSVSHSALTLKEITVNALSESHNERLSCTGQQERSSKNIPTLIRLPKRDILVNTEVGAYISHMNSPSSFYVHLAEDENLIIKLANDLNESLENGGLEICLDELMVGDLIVAEHEADCFYYRAVIKTLKSGNSFEVEFIDYGNAAVLSSSKICRIPEKFLTLPRFSVHCFLSSVKNIPGESWTEKSASFARKVSNKPVTCKFLEKHGEQWEIDVICDGKSMSDDLLQEIDGSGWQNTQMCHWNSRPKQNGNDQDRKSRNGSGGQNKTEAVRMKNTSKNPVSILHQVINFGQVEAAEVVNISETGEFYVQLVKNLQILHELNVMLDKEAQKSDLLKVDDIEKGLECMTQSERNFKWYRSEVIEKFVREKLMLVFFMDYGTCEMVSLNNAKMLSDEIKSFPKQAVFCKWIWFKNLKKIQFDHLLNAFLDCEIRILFLRYLKSPGIWEVDVLVGQVMLQEYLNHFLNCRTVVGPEKCTNTNSEESFKINSVMWMWVRSGTTYPGFAIVVTDPSNFSIQFELFFGCGRKLSLLLSDLPDNLPALPKEHVSPGAGCLIKFGLKAEWYRAEITEVTSQSVVLTFIDYGFLKSIAYSDIHKLKVIPESLLYFPRLAHSCCLHDTVPAKEEHWSDEAIILFQKLLLKPVLIVHFIHYGSEMKLEVDLLYDNSSVGEDLIAAGHAVCSQSRCCPIVVDSLKSEETDLQSLNSSNLCFLCEPDYDENSDSADRS